MAASHVHPGAARKAASHETAPKGSPVAGSGGEEKRMGDAAKKTSLEDLQELIRRGEESRIKGEESLRESQKKTEKSLRKLENLFTGQWSKLMESLVEGDLINLLGERSIQVNRVLPRVRGDHEGRQWEVDLIAVNGEEIVVVEVKTTLKVDHLRGFIEGNLSNIKTYFPEYAERKIYGAVAYLKTEESVQKFAEKRGLFVIRATGSSASITNPKDFKPKAF